MSIIIELNDKIIDSLKYIIELKIEGRIKQEVGNLLEGKICPYCNSNGYYLHTLDKYYCFNCKKYID
jgi:hypothetical protein